MQYHRIGLLAALGTLGVGGCYLSPGDLGHDHDDVEAGASGSGGSSVTGGTGSGATGGAGAGTGGTGGTGGSGGGQACENAPVCGGDPVGTWVVTSSCLEVSGYLDASSLGLGCAALPVTGSLEVSGTWSARADGTYSDQTITTGDAWIDVPEPCLFISGTIVRCNQLGPVIQALGYSSAICETDSSGACGCDATVEQTGSMGVVSVFPSTEGPYTAAGNVVSVPSDWETVTDYSYCVSGTESSMRPITTRTGTITGSIDLAEQ